MENNEPNQQQTPAPAPQPTTPEEELKMPQEQFGTQEQAPAKSHTLLYILLAVLLILLVALGFLLMQSDAFMNMLLGDNGEMTDAPLEEPADDSAQREVEPTPEEEIQEIEAELESTDFEEFDAELDAIDSELDAELSQ